MTELFYFDAPGYMAVTSLLVHYFRWQKESIHFILWTSGKSSSHKPSGKTQRSGRPHVLQGITNL